MYRKIEIETREFSVRYRELIVVSNFDNLNHAIIEFFDENVLINEIRFIETEKFYESIRLKKWGKLKYELFSNYEDKRIVKSILIALKNENIKLRNAPRCIHDWYAYEYAIKTKNPKYEFCFDCINFEQNQSNHIDIFDGYASIDDYNLPPEVLSEIKKNTPEKGFHKIFVKIEGQPHLLYDGRHICIANANYSSRGDYRVVTYNTGRGALTKHWLNSAITFKKGELSNYNDFIRNFCAE